MDNPFPGGNAISIPEHESSMNIVPWAALGALSNIAIDPANALSFINRGLSHQAMGQPDLALVDFDHAILLDPNNALAYINRGRLYQAQGNVDSAIADQQHAISLNSNPNR